MSRWPRVILLGDSITQYAFDGLGWGSHVAGLLQRKCDIFNRGFSGYTTQYIIKILDELINDSLVQNVAAVTIFYGANDSCLLQCNSRQHVPLEKYEENLGKIIDRFLTLGVSSNKIIIIAPPPVDEKVWLSEMIRKGTGDKCDRSNQVTEKYGRTCQKFVEGEVYEVNDKMLEKLDELESNGTLYYRKEVEILSNDKPEAALLSCKTYLICDYVEKLLSLKLPLLKSYTDSSRFLDQREEHTTVEDVLTVVKKSLADV